MNIGAGGFWKYCWCAPSDCFSTACLITSFCLFLFYCSYSRISGTHKSYSKSEWHSSVLLQMAQWFEWKLTEMVQRKWGLYCAAANRCTASEFPVTSFSVPVWQSTLNLDLDGGHGTVGWLSARAILSCEGTESSHSQECFSGKAGLTSIM